MTSTRDRMLGLVTSPAAFQRLAAPVLLASGHYSDVFIDGKHAVIDPDDFAFVGEAMVAAAKEAGASFEAVGGLVLGAVPYTFAVAEAARCRWFMVRKEPKGRGTNLWIEGTRITPGLPVMLVDDVVTTGGSIRQAYERVTEAGAEVVFATTLVDRGPDAATYFASVGVAYTPMLTYRDLDIDPIGGPPPSAPPTS